jgi:hypothetical protein
MLPVVFVGGTGRSGTTIAAKLLGAHPALAYIPVEARFHADADGLCDAFTGRVTPQHFVRSMRTRWWGWRSVSGDPSGLQHILSGDHDAFDIMLRRYLADFRRDRFAASAALLRDLFGHYAMRQARPSWVEATPRSAAVMHHLARILPEARFVHMTRDGRDVADSVIPLPWGPDTFDDALEWWAHELGAIRHAEAHTTRRRRLTIDLADLVADPTGHADRLCDFLHLPRSTEMHAFAADITADAAHHARWRNGRTADQQAAIAHRYETLQDAL